MLKENAARNILIRKQQLAIQLQNTKPHPKPKAQLEQYTIPADLAAEIVFSACYTYSDVEGKTIIDLGTGTGRLALAAQLLGANLVIGVDIEETSLGTAVGNSALLRLHPEWVLGSIEAIRGPVDTVIMNPPFGTKQPHEDLRFLEKALEISKTVYSIHKSSTRHFLQEWLRRKKAAAEIVLTTSLEIPHQFAFHRKRKVMVEVDVFRIRSD